MKYHDRVRGSRDRARALTLVALVAVVGVVGVGCLRLDVGFVVHDAEEVTVRARATMPPLLLAMIGGEEVLKEAVDLGEMLDLGEMFAADPAAAGQNGAAEFAAGAEATIVEDSDGWRGVATEARVPIEALASLDATAPEIVPSADGWRFVWRSDPAEMMGVPDGPLPTEGEEVLEAFGDTIRFSVSVSLPGRLVETNGTHVGSEDGFTTARWTISDPMAPVDLLLVTETAGEDGGGGLGPAALAGIIAGSVAAVVIGGLWWWFRRIERRYQQPSPTNGDDHSAPTADGERAREFSDLEAANGEGHGAPTA